jgi:peptide chain release factor 1
MTQRAYSNVPRSIIECQLMFQSKESTAEKLLKYSELKMSADSLLANAFVGRRDDERDDEDDSMMKRAKKLAKVSDERRSKGLHSRSFMDGVCVAVKDNFAIENEKMTAGSRMLENYRAKYTATVIDRIEYAGGIVFGKTTMDEFGMGSHSKTSELFGRTRNPIDERLSPGGSSGGSAAAVANGTCLVGIGSDTGGSVRLPAAFQGIVGLKPSYGRCSRHGLVAYASSFDCPGILTRNVCDATITLAIMQGKDAQDMLTIDADARIANVATELISESQMSFQEWLNAGGERKMKNTNNDDNVKILPLLNVRVGIPSEFYLEETTQAVLESWRNAIKAFKELGATIVPISLPSVKLALPAYYVLACAEASSNLNRYDEIKFSNTRDEGFGEEVKKRIVSGAFSLSSTRVEGAYRNSEKIREKISKEFREIFESSCDVILTPTSAREAPFLEDVAKESKVESYAQDALTVPMSLAGLPAISIPCAISVERKRPIGLQLTAPMYREAGMLRVASALERKISRKMFYSTSTQTTKFPTEKLEEQALLLKKFEDENDYKQAGEIRAIVQTYEKYKRALDEIETLRELLLDENCKRNEREEFERELEKLTEDVLPKVSNQLKIHLLPKDPEDRRDVILEVRAGAGGAEAAKFAAELFRMYEMYSKRKNWKFETMSYSEEEKGGGVREAMAEINISSGDSSSSSGIYSNLKYESGVHRVQRVPQTETQGRIHTSTASVAIIPKALEEDIYIDEQKDLRIETTRSSGAGGQSVNTTDSAVRIVHIPTGITVVIQDERSQHKNKAKALSVIRARVFDIERRKKALEDAELRRSLIGSADRSERIRTYNFKDGRCKDHRGTGVIVNVNDILNGFGLDEIIEDLTKKDLEDRLLL